MAHQFETGFSVRKPMWHGLGTVLDEYPGSWSQARVLAGLDWDIEEHPLYDVTQLYSDGRADVKLVEGVKQLKRSDNALRLSVVNDTYQVIGVDVFGELFEGIMEKSDGEIRYETAGSLDEGRKVWALARLGDAVELPGDPSPIQPYFALMSSNDGTAALRAIATSVRIVCMNTWHAADVDATMRNSSYYFRHTKNWRDNLKHAKDALFSARENVATTIEHAKDMLRVKVNAEQARWFIKEFAVHRVVHNSVAKKPMAKRDLKIRMDSPRITAALDGTIAHLTQIMESRTTEGIRGSAYGLMQAAGEFADHLRDRQSDESYFTRTMMADKEPLKQAAVRLALAAAEQ